MPIAFLGALGEILSTFLLGFVLSVLHEASPGTRTQVFRSLGNTPFLLALIATVCALAILLDPLIRVWWVQCILLSVFPMSLGYMMRRMIGRNMKGPM